MKSRHIPLSTGGRGKVYHDPDTGWPIHVVLPTGRYRVVTNGAGNPVRLVYERPAEIVVAERLGPVVAARDGTVWIKGEDVSGGWVCETTATVCGRMEAR